MSPCCMLPCILTRAVQRVELCLRWFSFGQDSSLNCCRPRVMELLLEAQTECLLGYDDGEEPKMETLGGLYIRK